MLRIVALGTAALCVAVAIGIFVAARGHREPVMAYAGTPLEPPKRAADATLVDQNGRAVHLLDPAVRATFLFFGYTHCPDECPLALAMLARAYRTLPPERAARLRVVFVTVDPERDSAPVVKRYLAAFDRHFVGLTGTRAMLAPVWSAYGVAIDRTTRELSHGDAIYAIDATGFVVLIYPPNAPAADLAGDARKLTS
jgi:protein SCO1/2